MRVDEKAVVTPRPAPNPPWNSLETVIRLARNPFGTLEEAKTICGDIYSLKTAWGNIYFVTSPDVTDEIATHFGWNLIQKTEVAQKPSSPLKQLGGDFNVTSEGYFHKHYRNSMKPLFYPEELEKYGPLIDRAFNRNTSDWADVNSKEFAHAIGAVTLDVVCSGILNMDLSSKESELIRDAIHRSYITQTRFLKFGRIVTSRFSPFSFSYRRSQKQLRDLFGQKVDNELKCPFSGSYIHRFLKKEVGSMNPNIDISRKKLIDDALGLAIAGLDTVNIALTWAIRLVLMQPDMVKRIQEEVDSSFSSSNDLLEVYSKIIFTRSVFLEALRLYPPFPLIGKITVNEMVVDDFVIEANSWILFNAFSIHRDRRFYPDPLSFLPDRWKDGDYPVEAGKFLPFGAGTHRCLGWNLALLEGSLILAKLFHGFEMIPLRDLNRFHESEIPFDIQLNISVKGGLPLKFVRRNH